MFCCFPADVRQQILVKKEASSENWRPRREQEDQKLPHIKEEQEAADIIAFTFSPASLKHEVGEEKHQSSELHLNQTEESRDPARPEPDLDQWLESNHEDKISDASEKDAGDENWEESHERLSGINSVRNQNVSVDDTRCETGKKLNSALNVIKQSTTGRICSGDENLSASLNSSSNSNRRNKITRDFSVAQLSLQLF